MSVIEIATVAAVVLLLLTTLVAFGIGHGRWSIVSTVAAILVALGIPTYLFFAARLAHHEWRWSQATRRAEEKLTRVRDALVPKPTTDGGVTLEKLPDGLSIRELRQEQDRWQRALTRVNTWRGRSWSGASFNPPAADDATGTILVSVPRIERAVDRLVVSDDDADEAEPPADAAAPPKPDGRAIDPGALVFVFDDVPFTAAEGGGRYLGGFLVEAVAEQGADQLQLTVRQLAPRDASDARAWSRPYDSVTVFTELPSDRWLAFSRTSADVRPPADDDDPASRDSWIAPQPRKRLDDELDALVPEPFRDDLRRHALTSADVREAIDQEEWPGLEKRLESGAALPGEYWADVTFKERADLEEFLARGPADLGDDAGLSLELDLASAIELRKEGKLDIDTVFFRRRLLDGQTRIHGSALPVDGEILAEGVVATRLALEREKRALEQAQARLAEGLDKAEAELQLLQGQAGVFQADLDQWTRDAEAARELADRFAKEVEATHDRLRRTEARIVALGRELVDEVGAAVREIDAAAPPAAGRGAAIPGAAF
jgi:hypothetical protein